jgi:hypothetical protein
MRTTQTLLTAVTLTILGRTVLAAPPPPAPAITVTVNGTPVALTGTQPLEIKGAVLVPLRGVFHALGATVTYDPAARVVNARKGTTVVVLPLGAATATVNGRPQALSQPAQTINGTTLVPLRFVAQALGGYVQWVAATNTVQIQTVDPHLASLPALPGRGTVTGLVTGKFLDENPPTLTVRVNGVNTSVPVVVGVLEGGATVTTPGQPPQPVDLNSIAVGDQVTITRSPSGQVTTISTLHGAVRGTIKTIGGKLTNGDRVITLNDGTIIQIAAGAPVTMAGRHITLGDVMNNEDVVIRTDPAGNRGIGIAVVTPDDPNPTPPGETPPAPTPAPPAPDAAPPAPNNGGAGAGITLVSVFSALPLSGGAKPVLHLAAQTQTVPVPENVTVEIASFTDDAHGPLRAGSRLTVTLTGTPGGKASLAIPGIIEDFRLLEAKPGVYTGTFTLPKDTNVTGAAVLGRLTLQGAEAPLVQASDALMVDNAPPHVSRLFPPKGATIGSPTPYVYAILSDAGGVGVDPAATHISLDGIDLTTQAHITQDFCGVTPTDPLSAGAHQARIMTADRIGNGQTTEWQFTVVSDSPAPSLTCSGPPDQTEGVGQTLGFTLRAQHGGRASVAIVGVASDIPLGEGKPGIYTGEYTVRPGDVAQDTPVAAQFRTAGGRTVIVPLPGGISLAAGPPRAPRITDPPINDVLVGDSLEMAGTAEPAATVRVSVDFASTTLGGLFPLHGGVGMTEVTADDKGRWKADRLPLATRSLFGHDQTTVFTISAVTVAGNGVLSAPAKITARHG